MVRVHWTPLHEIDTLERELSRLFQPFSSVASEDSDEKTEKTYTPALEMQDTPEAILLKVELPGMQLDALDSEATSDSITICGDRQPAVELSSVQSEFRYGRFYRQVNLPTQIRNADVSATYVNGVLSLTLPKVDADKPKVVKGTVQ